MTSKLRKQFEKQKPYMKKILNEWSSGNFGSAEVIKKYQKRILHLETLLTTKYIKRSKLNKLIDRLKFTNQDGCIYIDVAFLKSKLGVKP